MIHLPTVFILGAGASMPYGFPSGKQLRDKICGNQINSILNDEFGSRATKEFIDAFTDSHIISIDAFLSRRSEFVEIGKLAIAGIICNHERTHSFPPINVDDWYSHLWNKLVFDVNALEDLKKNDIKIITFNYDRSLEFFLLTSIMNTFNVGFDVALQSLSYLPIIHFYGQLGELSLIKNHPNSHISYRSTLNSRALNIATKSIHIIPEARHDSDRHNLISEWFRTTHNICFLGFGFDKMNIARLGLKETLESHFGSEAHHLSVMASTLELTDAEVNQAGTLLTGSLISSVWKPHNGTSTSTLRHFADRFR